MFSGTDRPGVYHITDENTSVADLTSVSHAQDNVYGGLNKLLTAHDGYSHALYHVSRILNTAIDALLATLSDTMHIVVFEPVDVRLFLFLLIPYYI